MVQMNVTICGWTLTLSFKSIELITGTKDMGMRCTQFVGLHERAWQFVKSFGSTLAWTDKTERIHADGRIEYFSKEHYESVLIDDESERTCGMFDDAPLDNFCKDGELLYEERVQIEYWSSGPVIHTALWDVKKDQWVKETMWTDEEAKE
jgi:hypothetical protein